MIINRQLVEIASWRLISELCRRYPDRFTILETHPGSGLYDCLSLYDRRAIHVADLNRQGRFHVFVRADSRRVTDEPMDIWDALIAAEHPQAVLNEVCRRLGLAIPTHLPASTPTVLVYRCIGAFLAHATFGRTRWECRNGFFDTAGDGGGVVKDFDRFPRARERLRLSDPQDFPGHPASRFWFVRRNNQAQLCLETSGWAWAADGTAYELMALYRQARRIWPLISRIAGAVLP